MYQGAAKSMSTGEVRLPALIVLKFWGRHMHHVNVDETVHVLGIILTRTS